MKVKVYVIDLELAPRVKKWALRIGIPVGALIVGGVAFADLPGGYMDGQPLTKEELDVNFNYLQGEIATLQGEVHPASAFRAQRSTALNIPNGGAPDTPVTFDNVIFDLASEYDVATGKFTPKTTGTYLITCGLDFSPSTDGFFATAIVVQSSYVGNSGVQSSVSPSPTVATVAQVAAGQSVACHAYQSTGTSQAILLYGGNNNFSAARLW